MPLYPSAGGRMISAGGISYEITRRSLLGRNRPGRADAQFPADTRSCRGNAYLRGSESGRLRSRRSDGRPNAGGRGGGMVCGVLAGGGAAFTAGRNHTANFDSRHDPAQSSGAAGRISYHTGDFQFALCGSAVRGSPESRRDSGRPSENGHRHGAYWFWGAVGF